MSLGFVFWLCMILWLILGAWRGWPTSPDGRIALGGQVLLFLLFLVLGLQVFGWPIKT